MKDWCGMLHLPRVTWMPLQEQTSFFVLASGMSLWSCVHVECFLQTVKKPGNSGLEFFKSTLPDVTGIRDSQKKNYF